MYGNIKYTNGGTTNKMRNPIPYEPAPNITVTYQLRYAFIDEKGKLDHSWLSLSTLERIAMQIVLLSKKYKGFKVVAVERTISLSPEEHRILNAEIAEAEEMKVWEPLEAKKENPT